ncbi:MAG: dienelactone hydrolase family protein [Actinomycetota bacterium]|nr:dienelactone hydrolase family protein [Actinomycetota bacterium]
MDHKRYIAEEVVEDYADGVISRREALRRLVLVGLTVTSSAALLAACERQEAQRRAGATPTAQATSPTVSPQPSPARALPTEPITFPGPAGNVQGAWAKAAPARGGVLVIHENRGLNDHIRSVAGRLAAEGYSSLAVDLLSHEGGTASLGDPANAMAALTRTAPERFIGDMRAALDEIGRREANAKLGIVGFCFGGMQVWNLLNAGEPRLAAAVPFYGPAPENPDFSRSRAAVLAVYAELDQRVNATRDRAVAALQRAGLTHEVITYPGADHAFFNDTGPRYNAQAASEAYRAMLDWFGRHLA